MIELSVSMRFEAGDLAILGEQLAAMAREFATLTGGRSVGGGNAVAMPAIEVADRTPAGKPAPKRAKPPKRAAALERPPAPIKLEAVTEAPDETAPGAPATNSVITAADEKRPRLTFEELDPLVRRELKRLSMDGRIPSYKLWDGERDPRLPTLGALLARYGVTNLADFATFFGMEPPLSAWANPRVGFRASLPESAEVAA